jgi:hypothetical protein
MTTTLWKERHELWKKIQLFGEKIFLTSGPDDAMQKVEISGPLERYFGPSAYNSYG